MRLIDAERLEKRLLSEEPNDRWDEFHDGFDRMKGIALNAIDATPTISAMPVVRCGECANAKRIDKNESVYTCTHPQWTRRPHKDTFEESQLFHGLDGNDFCSYGEKKEDKQ